MNRADDEMRAKSDEGERSWPRRTPPPGPGERKERDQPRPLDRGDKVREDRQKTRDELPPVYPDDD